MERDYAGGEAAESAAAGSIAAGGIAESAGITAALACGELLPACGEPPPAAIKAALKLLAAALSERDEDGSAAELLARDVDVAAAAVLARAADLAPAVAAAALPAAALAFAWAVPSRGGSLIFSSTARAPEGEQGGSRSEGAKKVAVSSGGGCNAGAEVRRGAVRKATH